MISVDGPCHHNRHHRSNRHGPFQRRDRGRGHDRDLHRHSSRHAGDHRDRDHDHGRDRNLHRHGHGHVPALQLWQRARPGSRP